MKIIFIAEKMAMPNESVVSVLQHMPGIEVDLFHYDFGKEAQAHYDGEVDHNIRRYLYNRTADWIIYEGPAEGKCRPQIETFQWLKTKGKTICLVNDGGCKGWWPALQEYKDTDAFDLVVNQDGCPEWPKRPQDITCHPLLDTSYFKPKENRKNFFGGIHSFSSPHRDKATKFIIEQCGFVMGHRSDKWGDYQAYADFLCDTTITINFPQSGGGTPMLKFRPIEAGFAKCVLLEKKNPITSLYLRPGVDYIEYEEIEDIPKILKEITPEQIESISSSLHERVNTRLCPEAVWHAILSRQSFAQPPSPVLD